MAPLNQFEFRSS